jgi:hypothetical protein
MNFFNLNFKISIILLKLINANGKYFVVMGNFYLPRLPANNQDSFKENKIKAEIHIIFNIRSKRNTDFQSV